MVYGNGLHENVNNAKVSLYDELVGVQIFYSHNLKKDMSHSRKYCGLYILLLEGRKRFQ